VVVVVVVAVVDNSNLQIVLIGACKRSSAGGFVEDRQKELERIHGVVERLADYFVSVCQIIVKENVNSRTFVKIDDVVNPHAGTLVVCLRTLRCHIGQQQILIQRKIAGFVFFVDACEVFLNV
jgi:hypothetical protein